MWVTFITRKIELPKQKQAPPRGRGCLFLPKRRLPRPHEPDRRRRSHDANEEGSVEQFARPTLLHGVEARGIEPRSETRFTAASTCVVHRLVSPLAGR